jgi:hypothetical protein
MRWWFNMVKETGISIKPPTCNKSLKLDNINMIKIHRVREQTGVLGENH